MSRGTRALHDGIDAHTRRTGIPYLHPDEPTVQLDLLGSAQVIDWQEGKAAFLFASEGCWSELPHLYARYGTTATAAADREAASDRARPPRSSATRACRPPRWPSTC